MMGANVWESTYKKLPFSTVNLKAQFVVKGPWATGSLGRW